MDSSITLSRIPISMGELLDGPLTQLLAKTSDPRLREAIEREFARRHAIRAGQRPPQLMPEPQPLVDVLAEAMNDLLRHRTKREVSGAWRQVKDRAVRFFRYANDGHGPPGF